MTKKLIIKKNIKMSTHTTFDIGGKADYFTEIINESQLVEALHWAKEKKLPVQIIAGGSNILISDKGIRGLVIKMNNNQWNFTGEFLTCGAGALVAKIVEQTITQSLSGLEWFAGLPGTVGGAIYKNSHWHKHYFSDNLWAVKAVGTNLNLIEIPKNKLSFSYDWSSLQNQELIITEVIFKLKKANQAELKNISLEILGKRDKQPKGKSAGCIFKNPSNINMSAGCLIEKVGLKGKRIGDIKISEKHANFFINLNRGKATDVIKLINLTTSRIKKKFGVTMEPEIFFLGEGI